MLEVRLAAEALPTGIVRRIEDVPDTEWALERSATIAEERHETS